MGALRPRPTLTTRLARTLAALPLCFILLHPVKALAADAPCSETVLSLKKPLKTVQNLGGLFVLFDKFPALANQSALAIQLDSKMLKVHHALAYLCDTENGVPLDELATYVSRKMGQLGEEGFREKHSVLGRPEKEIQAWIEYAALAQKLKSRTLDAARLQSTLAQAAPYFNRYRELALDSAKTPEDLLNAATTLNKDVSAFLEQSPYLALALREKAQIPYWDIDENHGGS